MLPSGFARSLDRAVRVLVTFVLVVSGIGWESRARPALAGPALEGPAQITSEPPTPTTTATFAATGSPTTLSPSATLIGTAATEAATATLVPPTTSTPPAYPGPTDAATALPSETLTPVTATTSATPNITGTVQASSTPTVTATLPATGTITATITSAGGQVVFGTNSELILDFPPLAVTETVQVSVARLYTLPSQLPIGITDRSYGVEVQLMRVSDQTAVVATELPVSMVLDYADLVSGMNEVSQKLLAIYHFNAAETLWEALITEVSPSSGVLTATVSNFSPLTLVSGTKTSVGDYAKPWQPVVPSYSVDTFTGAVNWSVPIDVPVGRGGLAPNLTLNYSTGAVDELRGNANPQVPGLGMGWSLSVPHIERPRVTDAAYTPIVTVTNNVDETFRIVLDGVSSDLVCITPPASGDVCHEYRTRDEAFWRVQKLTGAPNESRYYTDNSLSGEYWLVTKPDGTKYRFGWSGNPCYFNSQDGDGAGPCNPSTGGYTSEAYFNEGEHSAWYMFGKEQGGSHPNRIAPYIWRWNLDRIEDTRGNVVSFYYEVERNSYIICNSSDCWTAYDGYTGQGWPYGYVRGGALDHVDYTRGGGLTTAYQVDLAYRTTTAGENYWPDDFDGPLGGDLQTVQTFWSKFLYTSIAVKTGSNVIRRYDIEIAKTTPHNVPIVSAITTTVGSQALPPTRFGYLEMGVYRTTGGCGGIDQNWDKAWLDNVINGYGGKATFNYNGALDWSPGQSGEVCDGTPFDGKHWLRRRVVAVENNPDFGGSADVGRPQFTVYQYRTEGGGLSSGLWLTNTLGQREYRGDPVVRVIQRQNTGANGGSAVSWQEYWFHQGNGESDSACGQTVNDQEGMQGRAYRVLSTEGNGTVLSQTDTRFLFDDLGTGGLSAARRRRFVAPLSVCDYPNNGSGLFSQTDYTYDSYGNVTRIVQHGDTARGYDEAITEKAYVYNTTEWIVNRVLTESVFTGDGFRLTETRYAYDQLAVGQAPTDGLLTKVEQGLDGWGWSPTTAAYDTWGNPTVITDALQHTTQTGYDSTFSQFPVAVTNALGQPSYLKWNVGFAAPEVITATNGAVSRLEYDTMGRLQFVYDHGQAEPTLRYSYPSGSSWTAPWAIRTEQRIDAYAGTAVYQSQWTFYDGLGRPVQTQTQAENGWLVVQSTAYDALGRPMTVTLPYTVTSAGGTYLTPNWALTMTVTTYDALGRVVQVAAADGTVTKKGYSNWEELVLDANGHQTQSERDGLGRLIVVREYTGTYASLTWNISQAYRTRYWYDALGRLFAVRDALGNSTRIEYDPLGRKVSMDDPSMGHWEYGYDLAGNLTSQTDAMGNVLTFTYDALNRLITKVGNKVGGSPTTLAEYAYDSGTWAIGHRTAMTDTSGVSTWTYDPLGRMLSETRAVAGGLGTYTTGWAYDAAGRVVNQTYPTGEEVVTAYNLRGLPVSVDSADIAPGYLTAATYNALGQITTQNWGNTLATSYSYDAKNARLLQMQLGSLVDLRYRYDKVGNILAITSTVNSNQVQTFTYDARDRLLTAQTNAAGNGQYSEAYGYNALGNIITRTISGAGQTYYYGRPSAGGLNYKFYLPLVTGDGAAEFDDPAGTTFGQPFAVISTTSGYRATYDLNGNQTLRVSGGITYTQAWDAENRLAVVTNTVTGQVTTFTYDGDGNRILQTAGTATTVYVGSQYEKDIASGVVTTYYYAGGQRIALRHSGTVSWLSGDHLGSTTLTTNNAGAKTSELLYSPFGTSRYSWGTAPTSYGFTGQRADATGLMYYVARYYDSAVGRWTQADSIVPGQKDPQNLNRYAYVRNGPTVLADPDGHDPCTRVPGTYHPDCGVDGWYATEPDVWSEAEMARARREFFGALEVIGSLVDVIDWYLTTRDCLSGECSPVAILGAVLPVASGKTLGKLFRVSDGVWVSAAGLRYGADNWFGNRVRHVLRHAADDPARAGLHGVFAAGRQGTLAVIDEAWTLAKAGGPNVKIAYSGNRTIYTVDMGRVVGYVGGQGGAQLGHPSASHILIVVENGNQLISAYPVVP